MHRCLLPLDVYTFKTWAFVFHMQGQYPIHTHTVNTKVFYPLESVANCRLSYGVAAAGLSLCVRVHAHSLRKSA